ncbi:MAG: hypothetical protein V4636_17550 [Pseudomonadota bacterium]
MIDWRAGFGHLAFALYQCAIFAVTFWWLDAIGLSEPVAVDGAVVFALSGVRGQ